MAQSTTATYQQILATANHWFEWKAVMGGVTYDKTQLISVSTSVTTMQGAPCIGNAASTEINIQVLNPSGTIPKRGSIQLYVRAKSATQTSGWLAQGTFYVDTRKVTQTAEGINVLTIHGYDAMMLAVADYPDTNHDWPYLDKHVVAEIASTIGVTVDSRTNQFLTSGYMVDLPANYTMRETLEHIASSNGGNFVITNDNKLLFVPLYGFEYTEQGYYLADENNNALKFGSEGWYILV